MTVEDIEAFVAEIDPEARHYFFGKHGSDFTTWAETELLFLEADDTAANEGWKAAIIRCTTQEYDPIAASIKHALLNDPRTTLTNYSVGCNPETGYIMHAFKFEAM